MAAETEATGALNAYKLKYRRYVTLGTDSDGKTIIKSASTISETDKKEPEKLKDGTPNPYAGMPVAWANAEREGMTLLSENEFVQYSVTSLEGVAALCPDPAIQLYIFQVGLASVQTSRANAAMKALKENESEPTPEFNDATIDLRSGVDDEGTYSINKAPSRRSKSDLEKLQDQLNRMGLTPEQQQALLASLAASINSSASSTEEDAA